MERSLEDQLRQLNELYSPTESEYEEEGTELRGSGSALTDSFRTEECHLLDNFLKVLNSWAAEGPAPAAESPEEAAGESELEARATELGTEEEAQWGTRGSEEAPRPSEVRPSESRPDRSKSAASSRSEVRESKRLFAYKLVEGEAPTLAEELAYYSQDGNGRLRTEDLPLILRSFGCNPTEKEVKTLCRRISDYCGESIAIADFLPILVLQQNKTYTTKEMLGVFAALDVGNKGKLQMKLLRKLLTTRGEKLSRDEWEVFLKEVDPTSTGFFNYQDVVRRLERNTFVTVPEKRRALIRLLRRADKRGTTQRASLDPYETELTRDKI